MKNKSCLLSLILNLTTYGIAILSGYKRVIISTYEWPLMQRLIQVNGTNRLMA